jgi:hypothetical protein
MAASLSPRSSGGGQITSLLLHEDRGSGSGGAPANGGVPSSGGGGHASDSAAGGRSAGGGGGNTRGSRAALAGTTGRPFAIEGNSTLGQTALDMPNEAKLWRTVLLFVAGSMFVAVAINSGILSVLGLNFHLQSPASYAMALAVVIVMCMSLYCVYCST